MNLLENHLNDDPLMGRPPKRIPAPGEPDIEAKRPENARIISDNLRRRRAALGWTQIDLAEKSGVYVKTIAMIETENLNPMLETLERLARAVDMPLPALMTELPDLVPIPRKKKRTVKPKS
ncbi:MAG: helix-turn-helix protein [Rhodoferax sp.]|nr:helix-turn-helix protein [Rhodoferax sp.]